MIKKIVLLTAIFVVSLGFLSGCSVKISEE